MADVNFLSRIDLREAVHTLAAPFVRMAPTARRVAWTIFSGMGTTMQARAWRLQSHWASTGRALGRSWSWNATNTPVDFSSEDLTWPRVAHRATTATSAAAICDETHGLATRCHCVSVCVRGLWRMPRRSVSRAECRAACSLTRQRQSAWLPTTARGSWVSTLCSRRGSANDFPQHTVCES